MEETTLTRAELWVIGILYSAFLNMCYFYMHKTIYLKTGDMPARHLGLSPSYGNSCTDLIDKSTFIDEKIMQSKWK